MLELVAVNVNIDLHGLMDLAQPVTHVVYGLLFQWMAISIPIVRFHRANAQGYEGKRRASKQTLISLVLLQAPGQFIFFFVSHRKRRADCLTCFARATLLCMGTILFAFDRPLICCATLYRGDFLCILLFAHPKRCISFLCVIG